LITRRGAICSERRLVRPSVRAAPTRLEPTCATRVIGGLSVVVLSGAIAWDLADDGFWSRHALFTSLVASFVVVAVNAAVLNEVIERRADVGGLNLRT
jgi:hypothetical protein